ncbi:hypothetical protein BJV78DRAFT_1151341 [Lactifluus subvellereus]|nr:hypothetical protein BJV78DRAFT_1151341 [Lactifluus subvellereus]
MPQIRSQAGSSQKNCCPFIVRSCWLLRCDAKAESETCVYVRSGKCEAAARVLNIVKGNTLGVGDYDCDGKGKGRRDENRKGHPLDQLREKVAEVLNANKVRFLEIEGSAAQKSRIQNNSEERVPLLHVMDESASDRDWRSDLSDEQESRRSSAFAVMLRRKVFIFGGF